MQARRIILLRLCRYTGEPDDELLSNGTAPLPVANESLSFQIWVRVSAILTHCLTLLRSWRPKHASFHLQKRSSGCRDFRQIPRQSFQNTPLLCLSKSLPLLFIDTNTGSPICVTTSRFVIEMRKGGCGIWCCTGHTVPHVVAAHSTDLSISR